MKPKHPDLLPHTTSTHRFKTIQEKIRHNTEFANGVNDAKTVAGIDQAFSDDKCYTYVVVMRRDTIIEEATAVKDVTIPYIPGYLAFREGPSIVAALKKIETDPDVLLLDGSGRIHYRQAGLASHIGLIFEKPSVGVAKNLLCGEVDLPEKMKQGGKRPIRADETIEGAETGDVIGYAYQSKQYEGKRNINPLYISPGHKIDTDRAVEVVSKYSNEYKLPDPINIADKKVTQLT